MKVYFVGAHSSGKSTIARYVSENYKLSLITEVARMILSEQELQVDALRSSLDVANKYQEQVFYRQLLEESKYTDFVSDRSAIDSLAYSAQHTNILSVLLKTEELGKYVNSLNNKDVIMFFVQPSKATLKDDGVRESLNWDGIISINAQIKLLLEMFGLKYFQINTENMQERVKLIDSVLSLKS
jgi:nicotinamide riboside kinase